jgi:hypothetical protein
MTPSFLKHWRLLPLIKLFFLDRRAERWYIFYRTGAIAIRGVWCSRSDGATWFSLIFFHQSHYSPLINELLFQSALKVIINHQVLHYHQLIDLLSNLIWQLDFFVVSKSYTLNETRKVSVLRMVLMIFKVDDSTIKETTKCEKNFSCLSEKRKELCKVTHKVEDEVFFVECQDTESCSYRSLFGYSFICTCPVRKVIYNKYTI